MGHINVPKYQYGTNTHLQTNPKMRSVPKKFEIGSINLQTAGIMNDMYAVTSANSETGNVLHITKEEHDTCIIGISLKRYSLNKGLKEFGEHMEEAAVEELSSLSSFTDR